MGDGLYINRSATTTRSLDVLNVSSSYHAFTEFLWQIVKFYNVAESDSVFAGHDDEIYKW